MTEVECAFDGCSKPEHSRLGREDPDGPKYCHGHYLQYFHGRELQPLRPHKRFNDTDGLRTCSGCEETKPESEFYRRSSGGLQRKCKTCSIRANGAANKARAERERRREV